MDEYDLITHDIRSDMEVGEFSKINVIIGLIHVFQQSLKCKSMLMLCKYVCNLLTLSVVQLFCFITTFLHVLIHNKLSTVITRSFVNTIPSNSHSTINQNSSTAISTFYNSLTMRGCTVTLKTLSAFWSKTEHRGASSVRTLSPFLPVLVLHGVISIGTPKCTFLLATCGGGR